MLTIVKINAFSDTGILGEKPSKTTNNIQLLNVSYLTVLLISCINKIIPYVFTFAIKCVALVLSKKLQKLSVK